MVTNQATVNAVDAQTLIPEADPRRRTILPSEIEARVQRLADIKRDQDP